MKRLSGFVESLVFAALGCLLRLVQNIVRQVLLLIQENKKGIIPPIHNVLLLTPAVVLADNIRNRQVKSETVVKAYIERIRTVNPYLNSVIDERYEEALKDAQNADKYVRTSGKTPEEMAMDKPLLGVPFTSKEAVAVNGLSLTGGLLALKGRKATKDSEAVSLMRSAGGIPLCVTNVPELCSWWDASNKVYGTTHNPHDLTRTPGGSSGGEGALIASAGSVMGLGNDLTGSIRNPSFFCGIFGHKPSRGIVSNEGQFPASHGTKLDAYNVTGPMCRYVSDLVLMLKVIAGKNSTKLKLDKTVDLKNVKIFYCEDNLSHPFISKMDPEMKQAVLKVVQHLKSAYNINAKKIKLQQLDQTFSICMTKIESAKDTSPRTSESDPEPKDFNLLKELYKFVCRRSNYTYNYLQVQLLNAFYNTWLFEETNEYNNLQTSDLSQVFEDLLGSTGVFILPSGPGTAYFQREQNLREFDHTFTGIFNILGFPVTQCPVGLSSEDLPLGVQVVSTIFNDHLTLAVAKEIETHFGGWTTPYRIL